MFSERGDILDPFKIPFVRTMSGDLVHCLNIRYLHLKKGNFINRTVYKIMARVNSLEDLLIEIYEEEEKAVIALASMAAQLEEMKATEEEFFQVEDEKEKEN